MNKLRTTTSLPILLFLLVTPIRAQNTGQITGTVTDSSVASVASAEVTVRNVGTGVQRQSTSDSAGLYRIPLLPAGEYEVAVKKEGFRSVSRSGIRLSVEEIVRLDFQLDLGAVTETVNVQAEAPVLQSETATVGTSVGSKAVVDLPLVSAVSGRDPVELLQVLPGATNQGVAGTQSINGGRIGTNDIQVDGASKVEELIGNSSGAGGIPSVETVSEIRLMTNVYSAEFGRSGGATVIVSTRSGTNQVHGTAYHFFRHDALAARNFFSPNKAPTRSNQWGFTVGGPIIRNRTFFFASHEGWRYRTDFNLRETVPTAAQLGGDFSRTFDNRGQLITIYDPATTAPNPLGSGYIRQPFPGNVIPPNRFDAVGAKVVSYYGASNFPGAAFTEANNYRVGDSGGRDYTQYMAKIDHTFTAKNTLSGKFFLQNLDQKRPIVYDNPFNPGDNNQHAPNRNFTLTDTHIFTPSVLNEFRFALNRHINAFEPKYPTDGNSLIGLSGLPSAAPATPRISATGYGALGNSSFGGTYQTTYEIANIVTVIRGRHTLKIGGDLRRFHFNRPSRAGEAGSLSFTGVFTNLPGQANTGSAIADMLLGAPASGSVTITPTFGFRSWYAAGFIQDDIRVSRTFTLNLGLRYDVETPFTEVADRLSNFDPNAVDPVTGLRGALRFAGRDGASRSLVDTDWNNWGPRIGFAWSPTFGGVVLRGGYGIVYSPRTRGAATSPTLNSGFSATTSFSTLDNLTPAFLLREGFPFHNLPENEPSAGFLSGQSVSFVNPKNRIPYVQQWSFGLQKSLPGSTTLDVSYVGNRGLKLPWGSGINLNQLPQQMLGNAILERTANPFAGVLTGSLGANTITRGQLMRMFPQYQNVINSGDASASSTYHSLQVKVEKRYSHGLYLLTSYTYSKLLTDSALGSGGVGGVGVTLQDSWNRRAEKGPSSTDLRHRLVVAGSYDLPFGRTKRWLQEGIGSWVAGGWQVNTIFTVQSGMPLTVYSSPNLTQSLGGGSRPNRVCDGNVADSERSIGRWFDTSCFVAPPQFAFGNSGTGIVRGPGLANVDLSLFKNIPITERFTLQFRGEFFNVLNHTNFGNPGTTMGVGSFGVISATAGGTLDPMGGPRIGQLALKLSF
jgi:hypothetical protein